MICNALTCFTDPLSARSAPTQERSSLPLVEKASRGAAAKIPPPLWVIVSFGLSGSPSCTMGTLSVESGNRRAVAPLRGASPAGGYWLIMYLDILCYSAPFGYTTTDFTITHPITHTL